MSDCCERSMGGKVDACPRCGKSGKAIAHVTLERLLKPAPRARMSGDEQYAFCASPACAVVYFATGGLAVFEQDDLEVPVWQKCPSADEVPVCYCFGHTAASIRQEYEATGQSSVVATITEKVKKGLCACEVNNPQGSCCLGNVQTVTRQVKARATRRSDTTQA